LFDKNEIYKPLLLTSRAPGVYGEKITNTMARGPMQLHRLYRLEAGPAYSRFVSLGEI